MRNIKKIVSTLLIILLLATQTTQAFCAFIPDGYYRFRNVNSDMYLNCDGTNTGSLLRQLYNPSFLLPQRFLASSMDQEYYSLSPDNAPTMALGVEGDSSDNYACIRLYNNTGLESQRWKFISNDDGTFRIESKLSNKIMTVINASKKSGERIIQHTYNATKNDQWFLEADVEEDAYLIRNTLTGKYLTLSGNSIKQLDYNGNDLQKFKIKSSSDGYYDIMPISNLDFSLEVNGWDVGADDEGALITASWGQSSEGQSWRFLVNPDGSYRIVSALSDCQKAITSINTTSPYLYSYTYNPTRNANWELIKANKSEYKKEGRNVIVDLDTDTYLSSNISSKNLTRFIQHLDKAYDLYFELVGKKPKNGEKIRVVASDNNYGYAWVYSNSSTIYWNSRYIAEGLKSIEKNDDWSFALLHEMGHLFDLDDRWNFHAEFFANFKMAYVLNKLDGNFRIYLNNTLLTTYSDVLKYYKEDAGDSYTKTLGATPMRFHNDGLTYMLLDQINHYGDWNYFLKAFNVFNSMASSEIPTNNLMKYDSFLNIVNEQSTNKDFLAKFIAKYNSQNDFIRNYFGNSVHLLTNQQNALIID